MVNYYNFQCQRFPKHAEACNCPWTLYVAVITGIAWKEITYRMNQFKSLKHKKK